MKKEPFPFLWVLAIATFFIVIVILNIIYTKRQVEEGLPYEKLILLSCLVIPYLASVIWFVPKIYVNSVLKRPFLIHPTSEFDHEKDVLKSEDDTRKTLAQIIGGAILFSGLIFTYNTFVLNREGQITDRFSKAVAQLGDEDVAVKLGGLYALERISKDSPRDYGSVLQIISAYVRTKSPRNNLNGIKEDKQKNTTSLDKNPQERVETVTQTALTIIGRAISAQDLSFPDIDLSNSNLKGAKFVNARLNGANFEHADLSEADFEFAVLDFARLNNTVIMGSNLDHANLEGVNLGNAQLIDSHLISANLRGVNLTSTILLNVNLTDANLEDAYLYGVNLKSCILTFEQLEQSFIDEKTVLPLSLESRSQELLAASRKRAISRPNTPTPAPTLTN